MSLWKLWSNKPLKPFANSQRNNLTKVWKGQQQLKQRLQLCLSPKLLPKQRLLVPSHVAWKTWEAQVRFWDAQDAGATGEVARPVPILCTMASGWLGEVLGRVTWKGSRVERSKGEVLVTFRASGEAKWLWGFLVLCAHNVQWDIVALAHSACCHLAGWNWLYKFLA